MRRSAIAGPVGWLAVLFAVLVSCRHNAPVRAVAGTYGAGACGARDFCLISERGVGKIRLGMTLDEARRAAPECEFSRTSDGEGVTLVSVRRDADQLAVIYAGEDDPAAPVDWTQAIASVEVFDPRRHTAEGVSPGMLILDAEKRLGRALKIIRSEIESREYVVFENQPPELLFRIDYSGVFPQGANVTDRYRPEGRIHSITVRQK